MILIHESSLFNLLIIFYLEPGDHLQYSGNYFKALCQNKLLFKRIFMLNQFCYIFQTYRFLLDISLDSSAHVFQFLPLSSRTISSNLISKKLSIWQCLHRKAVIDFNTFPFWPPGYNQCYWSEWLSWPDSCYLKKRIS
jgi:hypothetical protein